MTKPLHKLFSCLLISLFTAPAFAASIPDPPSIDAKSWVLMDYDSGDILAQENGDERVEPASITKVLTSYIAFDEIKKGQLHYDDEVLVSEKAWRQGIDSTQSRMFIKVGDHVKVIDLLRGIIIASGNDASVALSEHIAGSESVFADMMNQYAKRLGMNESHFADASGMPNPDHYTTAHDLVILARHLIHDFPDAYKIFGEKEFKYGPVAAQPNRNYLLEKDPSVDGIKTGHTSSAGYCLLSSAQRDGRRLIAAVMGTKSWAGREQASLELLNYGFRFYESDSVLGPQNPAGSIRVWKGEQAQVPVSTKEPVALGLPRGSKDKLVVTPKVDGDLIAPVEAGQQVGTVTVSLDDKVLRTEPLIALQAVPKGSLWQQMSDQVRMWMQ